MRVIGSLVLLAACVSPSAPESLSVLSMSPAAVRAAELYVAPSLGVPLTREEVIDLGLERQAQPVTVELHQDAGFAVAWHTPGGEARVGHRASVLGAWRIVGTPIGGDVAPSDRGGDDEEVVRGPNAYDLPVDSDVLDNTPARDLTGVRNDTPEIEVDWLDDVEEAFIEFWNAHPGCI